jgi:hypothetical protein
VLGSRILHPSIFAIINKTMCKGNVTMDRHSKGACKLKCKYALKGTCKFKCKLKCDRKVHTYKRKELEWGWMGGEREVGITTHAELTTAHLELQAWSRTDTRR